MMHKKIGRPKIEIDYRLIEKLSALYATDQEIANILGVSDRTLKNRGDDYYAAKNRGRGKLKLKLRKAQIKLAESGNVSMLIWLGKNMLGQSDRGPIEETDDMDIDESFL